MRSYDVTAEFYDILHAPEYLKLAERVLASWLGTPRLAVLDVGAGTGLGTVALAARCRVPIHAVEPAAGMRTVLLSRLAGQHDLLDRVTVHAVGMEQLGLTRMADFALCLNVLAMMDADHRRATLDALAQALVDGGRLVLQAPPEVPGPPRADLPSWRLGEEQYGGEAVCERADGERVRWRFTYRVTRGTAIIREETEAFDGFLVPAARFAQELSTAGFTVESHDHPDLLIARRLTRSPDGADHD
jgi:SAM-dependent methyltransferase